MVSDTGPGPSTLRKRISTKMESSEASKVFIKRKSTTCVEGHKGRLRGKVPDWHPHCILSLLCGAFLLVFLWPIILICLVHSPYSIISGSFDVCTHISWSRWILPQRHLGRASLDIASPLACKDPFLCMRGRGGLLTRKEKYLV